MQKPGVWLTPILENPEQASVGEFCGNLLIGYESQANAVYRPANDEFQIVDNERPVVTSSMAVPAAALDCGEPAEAFPGSRTRTYRA